MMKKEYKAPALTVVAFRAERGFASSGNPIENVAENINGYTNFILNDGEVAWADGNEDQVVYGDYGNGSDAIDNNDGLAAGYFGQQGSTSGWF